MFNTTFQPIYVSHPFLQNSKLSHLLSKICLSVAHPSLPIHEGPTAEESALWPSQDESSVLGGPQLWQKHTLQEFPHVMKEGCFLAATGLARRRRSSQARISNLLRFAQTAEQLTIRAPFSGNVRSPDPNAELINWAAFQMAQKNRLQLVATTNI